MSVARLHSVKRAQKDQGTCNNCGVALKKGDPYLWFTVGFRSHYKHKRCTKSECYPKPSVRESSQFASVLAAQEAFEESIDTLDSKDDIETAVADVAEAVRELYDQYESAMEMWPNGNSQIEELRDHYEGQADELESFSLSADDAPEPCDEHSDDGELDEDCEDCENNKQEWLDEMREKAREAVNNVEQM